MSLLGQVQLKPECFKIIFATFLKIKFLHFYVGDVILFYNAQNFFCAFIIVFTMVLLWITFCSR